MTAKYSQETISEIENYIQRASHLHTNFVKLREREPIKAAEYLWGAINSLYEALSLRERDEKLGEHSKVRIFAKELSLREGKEFFDLFKDAETLHAIFFHGFLSGPGLWDRLESAEKLYDKLHTLLATPKFV
ncbi:MAG: Archaeal PaREP1/PaREP8 family protein [Candidatus Bathyarchaeota archaeon BA2]|nr:MAG: Archaeal PaREP1/PaREP8 family protein [Candidatus Bathyarchaeota archaeon BA2]